MRLLTAAVLVCSLAWPAYADVTIKTVSRGPLGGDAPSVSYIKGTKMRTDVTLNGVTRSTIIDAVARQMIAQKRGTTSVGIVFGPVILVWFVTIAVLWSLWSSPSVGAWVAMLGRGFGVG